MNSHFCAKEENVETLLIRACHKYRLKTIKGISRHNKGFPDRIIFDILNRRVLFVEVKNKSNYEQQTTQKEWQKIIEQCDEDYFLIDGKQEMLDFIERYIKRNIPNEDN